MKMLRKILKTNFFIFNPNFTHLKNLDMKSLNDFKKTNKELNKTEMLSLKGGVVGNTYRTEVISGPGNCDIGWYDESGYHVTIVECGNPSSLGGADN
jgi:hypothetical protein